MMFLAVRLMLFVCCYVCLASTESIEVTVNFDTYSSICKVGTSSCKYVNRMKCVSKDLCLKYTFTDNSMLIQRSIEVVLDCQDKNEVTVHSLRYYLPKNFENYCHLNGSASSGVTEICPVNISTSDKSCSREKCNPGKTEGMEECEYNHGDVTRRLQGECYKRRGSCTIQVPRMGIDNYESCIQNDAGKEVNCSEREFGSLCYSKWAKINYTCEEG